MYKDLRYALDRLFLFMLFVTIAVFLVGTQVELDEGVNHAVEVVSMGVLGGYYLFFGHGIYKAKRKLVYFKRHWILAILLILPFVPIARLANFAGFRSLFTIGADTIWHLFDRLGLL